MTRQTASRLTLGLGLLLLSACAIRPYDGTDVASATFIQRAVVQEEGPLVISASVPTREETEAITHLDLYDQQIQPVWIKVENRSDSRARVATWSVDREYFSPIEVAYMNRKKFSSQGYDNMQRWFHDNALPRIIPAGETRSGFVFTHLKPGTKGFNLVVLNKKKAREFTFFVPLPGFVPDFMLVDFDKLYTPEEMRDLDIKGLRHLLENELSCCGTDREGLKEGAPLNVVLVGTGRSVRRAMLRGDWQETSADDDSTALARRQHHLGRSPDAIFSKLRNDGNERIQLHLWMAPWRVKGEAVWVGQVYYYTEGNPLLSIFDAERVEDSKLLSYFVQESVTADIDNAQRFLFQNLWYNGSLHKIGFVKGVGVSTIDEPRKSFGGAVYFTRGRRLVAFLSEELIALDEGEFLFDQLRKMDKLETPQ